MTVKNADIYIALVRILVFTYIAYIASSNVLQLCIFTHMYLQVAFEPMHTRVHIHIHAWDRHKINIIFHTNIVLKDTRMQYFNVAYDLEFVSYTLPWFLKDTRAIWYTAGSSQISTQVVPLADILLCTSYNNMNWIIHISNKWTMAGSGEFPSQRPVTRSFDFFSSVHEQRWSKQSRRWWFEPPLRPLWRHCDEKTW